MQLIAALASPFARKVRILLLEKNIPFEVTWVDNVWLPDSQTTTHNPLGQVPCLVMSDGEILYDSKVIAEYLELLVPMHIPTEPLQRIEAFKWSALADGLMDAVIKIRVERMRAPELQSPAWIERQMQKIAAGLALIDARLGHRLWCANNAYSVADVGTVCLLDFVSFRLPEYDWRSDYLNLAKLSDYLNMQPAYQSTLPRFA